MSDFSDHIPEKWDRDPQGRLITMRCRKLMIPFRKERGAGYYSFSSARQMCQKRKVEGRPPIPRPYRRKTVPVSVPMKQGQEPQEQKGQQGQGQWGGGARDLWNDPLLMRYVQSADLNRLDEDTLVPLGIAIPLAELYYNNAAELLAKVLRETARSSVTVDFLTKIPLGLIMGVMGVM
jgi:hypothetical protein